MGIENRPLREEVELRQWAKGKTDATTERRAGGRGLTLHDEALDIHLKQWQDISTACNSADQSTSICHALRPFNGSSS
jgi:hypothetical protein